MVFTMLNSQDLLHQFGQIDIYLFDQIVKGRFDSLKSILDAGCGAGRNLIYFLQKGYQVYAVDREPDAVHYVRELAARLAPDLPANHFRIAPLEALPFADALFEAVICSAVLHFARDEAHFQAMLDELWRVLQPGGIFFARLTSDIGIENLVQPLGNRRYALPDNSERFLVNQDMLLNHSKRLGGRLPDPLKTTNVENVRCMTTWVLQKQ